MAQAMQLAHNWHKFSLDMTHKLWSAHACGCRETAVHARGKVAGMLHDVTSHLAGHEAVSRSLNGNQKCAMHFHIIARGSQILATMPKIVTARESVARAQQRPMSSVNGSMC